MPSDPREEFMDALGGCAELVARIAADQSNGMKRRAHRFLEYRWDAERATKRLVIATRVLKTELAHG